MNILRVIFLLSVFISLDVLGAEKELPFVYQVLGEFNTKILNSKIDDKLIHKYAVKAANALSKDWSTGIKETSSKEILKVWEGKSELNSVDSFGLLKTTRFKLELAGYIGMAIDKCLVTYDKSVIRLFVNHYLNSNNARIRIAAIRNLGFVGSNEDIDYLSGIVLKQEEGWSKHAAMSLDLIGTNESVEALLALREEIDNPDLSRFIDSIAAQYSGGVKLGADCKQGK